VQEVVGLGLLALMEMELVMLVVMAVLALHHLYQVLA
jgi:hypothetical protein